MSDTILDWNFELRSEYVWLTDWLKEDLEKIALGHVEKMQTSYLKKYVNTTAEVHFHLRVEKTKDERYECKFHVNYDGHEYHWHNDTPFKEPFDVVNHAFKHLKEHLANK